MEENYLMNIVTNQCVDGQKEVIEMTTLASFEGQADDYYISYTDDDGDLAGCRTTLHVENGNCVTFSGPFPNTQHLTVLLP